MCIRDSSPSVACLSMQFGLTMISKCSPTTPREHAPLVWALPRSLATTWGIICYFPVSYTHLDVYKRQLLNSWLNQFTETTSLWYALSRSYSINLPSSFSTAHPSALESVSYTHLDVYKRQIIACAVIALPVASTNQIAKNISTILK